MINPLGLNSLSEPVGEVIITDIPDQDSCPLSPFNRFCWPRDPASTPINYEFIINSPAGANSWVSWPNVCFGFTYGVFVFGTLYKLSVRSNNS